MLLRRCIIWDPNDRALSLALTGDGVVRDMFYDGIQRLSWAHRLSLPRVFSDSVRWRYSRTTMWKIDQGGGFRIDPLLSPDPFSGDSDRKQAVIQLFREVSDRTARLISQWMSVGFVHGVMNTDNMSLLGLTIDYGPYGWLDIVDSDGHPIRLTIRVDGMHLVVNPILVLGIS